MLLGAGLPLGFFADAHILHDVGEMPFALVVEIEVEHRRDFGKRTSVAGLHAGALERVLRRDLGDERRDVRRRQIGIERDGLVVLVEFDAHQRAVDRDAAEQLAEFDDPGAGQRHGLDAEAFERAYGAADGRSREGGSRTALEGVGEDALGRAFRVEILRPRGGEAIRGRAGPFGAQRREGLAAMRLRHMQRQALEPRRFAARAGARFFVRVFLAKVASLMPYNHDHARCCAGAWEPAGRGAWIRAPR